MSFKRLAIYLVVVLPVTGVVVWLIQGRLSAVHPSYFTYEPTAETYNMPVPEGAVRVLGPNAIPSIDAPEFVSAKDADLPPGEPMIVIRRHGETRAYSTVLLNQHEIVNDEMGGEPIAVTW